MRRQNVWVGRLRVFVPNPVNGGEPDGGDWDQPIEDPYIYQIDREWLSEQDYQALFLQPTAFGDARRTLGTWTSAACRSSAATAPAPSCSP